MEFLMTYGWALLIVVLVAAVVFLVVRPAGLVGESKVSFSGIDVTRFGVDSANDVLLMEIQNIRSTRVNVTAIYVESATGTQIAKTDKAIELASGKRSTGFINATLPVSVETGESYAYRVFIEYYYSDLGPTNKLNSTGTLSGTAS